MELPSSPRSPRSTLEISSPPVTSCNVDYDNPADPTEVGDDTLIADVPELQQLLRDAAQATALQFPAGDPTADALVVLLDATQCSSTNIGSAGVCAPSPGVCPDGFRDFPTATDANAQCSTGLCCFPCPPECGGGC